MNEPGAAAGEQQGARAGASPMPEEPDSKAEVVAANTVEQIPEQRVEILLAEYHEIIETLRNWDTIIYQMLAIVSSVIAAIVAILAEGASAYAWFAIVGLFLFWAVAYLWQYRLANQRIKTIIEIEQELNMKGQYRRVEGFKKTSRFARFVDRISP